MTEPSLAVIGAGPAGLAAALAAAARGIRVTLIDSAAEAGGQFYRQPAPGLGARRPQALHHQWRTWERLRDGLRAHVQAGTVRHMTDHHVWFVERRDTAGFAVHALVGPEQEQPAEVRAAAVLLATGGYEKVLPFPGWTLPGVVTAGGAQAMLKGGLVLPGRTAVVAGTGPLLLPVATGLAAAGATVAALVDSADPKSFVRRSRTLAGRPGKVAEGAQYAGQLLRHRVRTLLHHRRGGARRRAAGGGDDRGPRPGRAGASGHPPTPRLRHPRRESRHAAAHRPRRRAGLPGRRHGRVRRRRAAHRRAGVWAAGETTGIGGSALSLAEGHIAGRSVAARLAGRAPDPGEWAAAARTRAGLRAFFAAVDSVYVPPAHWAEQVTDGTVVCRCEEVSAGAVREAVRELGAGDLRTVKLLTRAGMGWCQGRVCGPRWPVSPGARRPRAAGRSHGRCRWACWPGPERPRNSDMSHPMER